MTHKEIMQHAQQAQTLQAQAQVQHTMEELKKLLMRYEATMRLYGDPERIVDMFAYAIRSNPALLRVIQHPHGKGSLFNALIAAVQLRLDPRLRHVHFVPFETKQGPAVQLIIDYRGYLDLIRRAMPIKTIQTAVVYEGDEFQIVLGSSPSVHHVPALKDRGAPVGAYALVAGKGGELYVEYMTVEEIERIRLRSRARDSGPWITDWEMMARKTVLRRLQRYLPQSPELAEAQSVDDVDPGLDSEETESYIPDEPTTPSTSPTPTSLASPPQPPTPEAGESVDPETGEVLEEAPQSPRLPEESYPILTNPIPSGVGQTPAYSQPKPISKVVEQEVERVRRVRKKEVEPPEFPARSGTSTLFDE
jgi:recombination protein RecT